MEKFKVGDLVEVIKPSMHSTNPVGYKGFITSITFSCLEDYGSCYCHQIDGNECGWEHAKGLRKIDIIQEHSKKTIRNQSVLKKLSRLPHLVPERIEEGVEHA